MKKVILTLCVALASINVFAQEKGEKSVGAHLIHSLDASNLGIGVKGRYSFTDAIRGEASFNYFLRNNLDLNANAHYLFPLSDKLTIFPLAGMSYGNSSLFTTGNYSNSYFGLNLGGGADYKLTEKLSLNAESKYQIISGYSSFVLSAGVIYKF